MVQKVTELFLEVIEANINNVDTIILLYRIMFFSEKTVTYILENNYLGILVEQYEKIINQAIREFDNPERSSFVNETLRDYFYGGSDFYVNLTKHTQAIGNFNAFDIVSNNLEDDFEPHRNNSIPAANFDQIQSEGIGNQMGTNNPNSEQSSFYLPPGNNMNFSSQGSLMKLPIKNFASSFHENMNIASRSNRRADAYKSVNTNSNRPSQYRLGSSSADSGGKENPFQKNENNISIVENDSYVQDGNLKMRVYRSAKETMKSLANQLGEYCLSIDLGCLLAQKRKLQLDQVAKVAVFQGKLLSVEWWYNMNRYGCSYRFQGRGKDP